MNWIRNKTNRKESNAIRECDLPKQPKIRKNLVWFHHGHKGTHVCRLHSCIKVRWPNRWGAWLRRRRFRVRVPTGPKIFFRSFSEQNLLHVPWCSIDSWSEWAVRLWTIWPWGQVGPRQSTAVWCPYPRPPLGSWARFRWRFLNCYFYNNFRTNMRKIFYFYIFFRKKWSKKPAEKK